jgi:ribosome-binding protein aMBF1 (putative translation factor)
MTLSAKKFRQRLRIKRITAGLSQRQLAAMIGTGQDCVSLWESGKWLPSQRFMNKLLRFLALDDTAIILFVKKAQFFTAGLFLSNELVYC